MEQQIQKLYVEASSRCNLACKMCFRHSWVGERFGDLDPEVFARVMVDPALRDTGTVFFGGMGEPLVHPELARMAALASARRKKVELITNGTLLNVEKVQELLQAGAGGGIYNRFSRASSEVRLSAAWFSISIERSSETASASVGSLNTKTAYGSLQYRTDTASPGMAIWLSWEGGPGSSVR